MCPTEQNKIGEWNVWGVTNMNRIFYNAGIHKQFNHNISQWDVRNVTSMEKMFWGCDIFNKPIGDWDVSNVTNMREMFALAEDFNQDIGRWNVGNVTNMEYMFWFATHFNQDIGNWDVRNVQDMEGMFAIARSFNQPSICRWNVSNVESMKWIFSKNNSVHYYAEFTPGSYSYFSLRQASEKKKIHSLFFWSKYQNSKIDCSFENQLPVIFDEWNKVNPNVIQKEYPWWTSTLYHVVGYNN